MRHKIATIAASTILSLTVGSAPSYALSRRVNFVSNSGVYSETINLDNGKERTFNGTATKQVVENGEVLIAGRYKRRQLRRRRRRGYRRFHRRYRNRVINRGIRRRNNQRRIYQNNRRIWRRTRPIPGYIRRY
ncbi:MAG: hypothetical protein AAF316_03355 [Cyanobacteria bacterium P01_A01_bin.80]